MDVTPRDSTVPNEYQLEQKAALYSELHPDGPPAKTHPLIRLLRRALSGFRRTSGGS
jgi:hypothetical protein